MSRKIRLAVMTAAIVGGVGLPLLPAQAADTASISGIAFEDGNRNGAHDVGEPALGNHVLYLFDGGGGYLRNATTDANGRDAFTDLTPATYRVDYSSMTWSSLKRDWVPTTTGSLRPSRTVTASTSTSADFGWRRIVWSTTLGSPVSTATGANGVRVDMYTDGATAAHVLELLNAGSLLGGEGASISVAVGYGDVDQTVTSSAYSSGRYSSYQASVYVTWDSWLSNAEATLFHEYGHAWSLYFATMVQQDTSLSGYLQARGLAGDSRVDSGYSWNRKELIAEDYRQLFGSDAARTSPQANTSIPPATAVAGLADYLSGAFRDAAAPAPPTTPPADASAPVITGLAMNPAKVSKSGTAGFSVSTAARVNLSVRTGGGALVKELLTNSDVPAGSVSATWKRTTAGGQRAKSGTYQLVVQATNSTGTTQQSVSFSVS
jgi:hypothetical protein